MQIHAPALSDPNTEKYAIVDAATLTTVSVAGAPIVVIFHAWIIETYSVELLCLINVIGILSMLFLDSQKNEKMKNYKRS
jgi:hypothetical protein